MYAVFEVNDKETLSKGDDTIIRIDTKIQSLSWMNKINNTPANSTVSAAQNSNQPNETETHNTHFKNYLNQQVK
jgi:hypothetical protein